MNRRDVTRMGTCCYCGARTMLELTARGGHELACGACGAPIHHMKGIKSDTKPAKSGKSKRQAQPAAYGAAGMAAGTSSKTKSPKKKSKKSFKRKAKGVFDVFEDVFDDVFDLFD